MFRSYDIVVAILNGLITGDWPLNGLKWRPKCSGHLVALVIPIPWIINDSLLQLAIKTIFWSLSPDQQEQEKHSR